MGIPWLHRVMQSGLGVAILFVGRFKLQRPGEVAVGCSPILALHRDSITHIAGETWKPAFGYHLFENTVCLFQSPQHEEAIGIIAAVWLRWPQTFDEWGVEDSGFGVLTREHTRASGRSPGKD